MKKELVKFESPELDLIETSKADQIKNTFLPMAERIKEFEKDYLDILKQSNVEITEDLTKKAKRLRLDISKIRTDTEKVRKEQKEEYLRAGKAIDGVSNIVKWAVSDKEKSLKEIEDHFETLEKRRLEELQSIREGELSKYVDDANERVLNTMDDDVWFAYLETKKKEYNDRIEAEKKAEEERVAKEKAYKEEQERIRKENEKLKREAQERERIAKIESEKRAKEEKKRIAKQEAEKKAAEEKQRKEREAYEAKLKAEREERERLERVEKENREKLEAELRAKEQEEQRKLKEKEEKIQFELKKGDKAKVIDLVSNLTELKTKYTFKAKKNQKMYSDVSVLIDKVINHINN